MERVGRKGHSLVCEGECIVPTATQTANKAFYCSLSRNKISINFIAHKIQRFIDVISRVKDNAAYISLEIFNAFAKNQTVDNNAMHAKPVLRVALKHIGL